jgi:MFS family permease
MSRERSPSEPSRPLPVVRARLPAAVIALGFTSLFTDVATEMIFPLLPVFLVSLGAGPAFLGLVEGVADATSSLLKLASGHLADRMEKRRPLVLFGYGIAALVRPLVALATAPWHVLAVRVTDRVGKGVRSSPRDAIIAASVPREQSGRAFGFHQAMDHAGAVLGPLAATLLLACGVSLRGVFAIAAIPGVLSILALLVVREPAVPLARAPDGAAGTLALGAPFRRYLAVLFVFTLGSSSDAFLLLRARECGVSLALLPTLWATFNVSRLVCAYFGGALSDRVGRVRLVLSGWLVYAATYAAFGAASAPWHAWALFVFYGLYYGLTEPVEKALVRDLVPEAVRGRAYGEYNFVLGITAVPAGLLTGFLWQRFGAAAALNTGAGLSLAAAGALFVWSRSAPTHRPA